MNFVNALFPQRCMTCSRCTNGFFCDQCQQMIYPAFCTPCNPISDSRIDNLPSTHDRQQEIPAFWLYHTVVQQIIHRAKFGPDQLCAQALVSHWLQTVDPQYKNLPFFSRIQAVCFVPTHWRRRVQRGFDLPALFARSVAEWLKTPLIDALVCKQFHEPLSLSSSREQRIQSVKNRYQLRISPNCIRQKRVLLVDDVVTTGATLQSAQKTLQAEQAIVKCLALAATPKTQKIFLQQFPKIKT